MRVAPDHLDSMFEFPGAVLYTVMRMEGKVCVNVCVCVCVCVCLRARVYVCKINVSVPLGAR